MSRKSCRSIRDHLPTPTGVLEAGSAFEPQGWNDPRFPNIRSGIAELGLQEGQFTTRGDVFRMVKEDPRRSVMLTVVWGYRKGTINGHRKPVEAVFREAGTIADGLEQLRQGQLLPARVLIDQLNLLCGTGVSTSTTSKLAYFFGLPTQEGASVIYDYKVINTIMEGTYREFLALRRKLPVDHLRHSRDLAIRLENARNRQRQTFADYIRTVDQVTKWFGGEVAADQVELALFKNAPDKEILAARTRSSKKIQARNERRALARALKNIDEAEPQAA